MLKSAQGTRAASFSAKIRSLQEYHNRLLNSLSPLPSSVDIINVLKFFSQALLTILRDIPCLPIDLIRDPSRDSVRINFFPNLDYRTLYHALAQMLDSFSSIQSTLAASAPAVFEYLLHAIVCLVPFLEHELMDSMPMVVASTISLNFVSHQDIIDMLCYNILPFTLYHESHDDSMMIGFADASIPSILMVVLTHTDSLSLHSQLLECLMRLKGSIIQDLLVVIAYGTGKSRHAAVELLFQYWPGLNPSALDRRTLSEKHVPWKPLTCQNDTCQNTLNNEAVKICFAQIESIGNPGNAPLTDCKGRPPIPLLICIDCAELVREHSSVAKNKCPDVLLNVLHPMTEICYSCESKSCLSAAASGKHHSSSSPATVAVVTCFSLECTSYNCNKPVRLCAQCHASRHQMAAINAPSTSTAITSNINTTSTTINGITNGATSITPGGKEPAAAAHPLQRNRHLVQEHLQSLWQLPPDAQQHFTEAVISLLREASVLEKSSKEGGGGGVRTHGIGGGGAYSGLGGGGACPTGSFTPGGGMGPGGVPGGGGGGAFGEGGPGGPGSGPGSAVATEAVDSTIEERQLLSRYGIWLLIGLCDPTEATTTERMELLGRMLAMLCQWFHNTACLPDDQAGSALERIKSESIHGWLMKVIDSQFQLFANCLIPTPPDYAQIGGHWESWPSTTSQIKEGFKRLLCLVPYDIITADIWAYIMPFWMESFRVELEGMELAELKILLSKVLDPDLSPLGLPPKQMYHFISVCFDSMVLEQEQALTWLQILTLLEIPVPINLLNTMFQSGISSFVSVREMKEGKKLIETDLTDIGDEGLVPIASTSKLSPSRDNRQSTSTANTNAITSNPLLAMATLEFIVETQLFCYVLMLDILLKQFELQEVSAHKGVDTSKDANNTVQLLYQMISVANCTTPSGQVHTCGEFTSTLSAELGTEIPKPEQPHAGGGGMQRQVNKPNSFLNACSFCDLSSIWYQLSLQLIAYFAPLVETTVMPEISGGIQSPSDPNICLSPLSATLRPHGSSASTQPNGSDPAPPPPVAPSASDERSTLYSINEEHQTEDGMGGGGGGGRASTSSAMASSGDHHFTGDPTTVQSELGDGTTAGPSAELEEDDDTMLASVELNMTEKLTVKFLQELELQTDPDVIYHLLQCLKLLTLHAGILNRMAQDEKRRKFFIWCQKRYLITIFWRLIQAEFSQISQISVPLVLHCIALPGGLSVFSRMVNADFKHPDWCVRFATIERVCSFSQFIEQASVKNSNSLQSALSSLIIHLVQVLDDLNAAVSQRALLSLELMRAASLRLYVYCLELQFDLVIVDRCLVLNSLLQLFNHLSMAERRLLTWDFFLNRFDALFLEAQLHIQRSTSDSGGGAGGGGGGGLEPVEPTRDLRNTNVHSETYKKKIGRAYEALAQTHLRRSLLPHHGRTEKSKQSRHHLSFSIFGAGHSGSGGHGHAGSQQGSLTRKFSHQKDGFGGGVHSKDKLMKNLGAPSTTSSAANRKSSKLAALTGSAFPNNFFHESGQSKRDLLQEELQMFNVVHRVLDEADIGDQETMHLLVYLFMQFLSWPDSQHPTDDKSLNRTQIIVLRHLNTLLGYSASENQFFLPAYDLRRKSIFSSFLLALPDVLDLNLPVGALLLPSAFPVLVYCPSGHRFVYTTELDAMAPTYSLWLLQPLLRLSWLQTLIVILYKHNIAAAPQYAKFVHLLVQIVMNTLESALGHRCSPTETLLRKSKATFTVEGFEMETKSESITEEVVECQPLAIKSSARTAGGGGDTEEELMMPSTSAAAIAADAITNSNGKLDRPITIDIEFDNDEELQQIAERQALLAGGGGAEGKEPTADSSDSRKSSSESSTLKHQQQQQQKQPQSDTSLSISGPGQSRSSQEPALPSKKYPLPSSTSEDNESVSKSLAESIGDNQSLTESSSQFGTGVVAVMMPAGGQKQLRGTSSMTAGDVAGASGGDDDSEVTSDTSSITAQIGGLQTPPGGCAACACAAAAAAAQQLAKPMPPVSIERLLPIGGELSESVRLSVSRRPYPSVIAPTAVPPPSSKPHPSSASSTNFTSNPPPPPIAAPSSIPLEQYGCCCCYQASIGQLSSCCAHYQQTIEAFKKQHMAATRELSRERLLPIGPKPMHNHNKAKHALVHQSHSVHTSRPSSSAHHSSYSSSTTSRSVERRLDGGSTSSSIATATEHRVVSKPRPANKLLIRQHTTIGGSGGDGQNENHCHSSPTNTSAAGALHGGGGAHHHGALLPSKSVDSVPDKFISKFDGMKITGGSRSGSGTIQKHHQSGSGGNTTAATTTNSSMSSVMGVESIANYLDEVVTSATATATTVASSTSGAMAMVQRMQRKSTATSNNSEESICTPVKEQHQQQPFGSHSNNNNANSNGRPKNSSAVITTCNGLGGDDAATDSEQEPSKSSGKAVIGRSNGGGNGKDAVNNNGFSPNGKHSKEKADKPKKKAKKKSKKGKSSSKSTPISTTNNTPCHHQATSPTTGTLPTNSSMTSMVAGGGGGADSPITTGDNEVFGAGSSAQAGISSEYGPGGGGGSKNNKSAGQSLPDSAKDTISGRSNEASSSSDLTCTAFELCTLCGLPIEKFDEQELGLCLVSLATFVHRDPMLAAPLLPQVLRLTSRYAIRHAFPWQIGSHVHLPANTGSIARQFIRCTLHQLASNGIFRQIFQSHLSDVILFRSMAISLADFIELNQVTPLKELFESLMEDKHLPPLPQIMHTLTNVANYFECVFMDYNTSQGSNMAATGLSQFLSSLAGASAPNVGASIVANQPWSDLMAPFEAYLRKLAIALSHIAPSIHDLTPLMRVLLALFKIPGIGAHRSILDPVMKILTHIVQHCPLLHEQVRELCILCSRAYVRDRERLCVARTFALELVQTLRFRTHIPDENVLLLVQWALEDTGGSLPYSVAAQMLERTVNKALGTAGISVELPSTSATEALRMHTHELIDFITDAHALAKIKSNFQGTSVHLNEETLGGHLKAGIAQFLALELTRATSGSDHRAITKYLPWLYSLPSLQQGSKEFLECISHVRLLSWLLLGSLQHTALMKCHPNHTTCLVSQPIPFDANQHIAEHVQAILAGFAEQSKASVMHMSALFYAFLLCQLWTIYCEQLSSQNPPGSDAAMQGTMILSDFWSKVTPGVLQLICHSNGEGVDQLADTVSLHFLSLMEGLLDCNSELLTRLIEMWIAVLQTRKHQLSSINLLRLQAIASWPIPAQTRDDAMMTSTTLIRWLQKIQTKMSQIEMQSSTATQFYCI